MNNENEIVDDLKNWKEIIKPYATPEVKLARKEVWKTVLPGEVIRSTEEEKQLQIQNLENFQKSNEDQSEEWLRKLQLSAINQQNLFEVMMEAVKYCSLGQITNALFEVGGKYRRNM